MKTGEIFQSTPSVWRETPSQAFVIYNSTVISIHSLRVEGDQMLKAQIKLMEAFQSTPSVWRETY